ncbi:MAG: inorganic diphosphatase, partial [Thermoplasmata archaeon]
MVKCRPIGIAEMHDEEGEDNKIIAVPVDNV